MKIYAEKMNEFIKKANNEKDTPNEEIPKDDSKPIEESAKVDNKPIEENKAIDDAPKRRK